MEGASDAYLGCLRTCRAPRSFQSTLGTGEDLVRIQVRIGRGYRLEKAGVSRPRAELVSAKLSSGVAQQSSGQKLSDQWRSGNGRTLVRNLGNVSRVRELGLGI